MSMRKISLFITVMVVLISCQKETSIDSTDGVGGSGGSGGGANSLIGNWKFIGISASTESTVELTDGTDTEKTVTVSNYSSTNNTGTYNFTASKMSFTGVGYTINSNAMAYLYLNNDLIDSLQFPFSYTLPPSNGETAYKKVGSDSLYFESGSISIPASGTQQAQSGGVKYRFEGDKMIMTNNYQQRNVTDLGGGATQVQVMKVTGITTLQKQ